MPNDFTIVYEPKQTVFSQCALVGLHRLARDKTANTQNIWFVYTKDGRRIPARGRGCMRGREYRQQWPEGVGTHKLYLNSWTPEYLTDTQPKPDSRIHFSAAFGHVLAKCLPRHVKNLPPSSTKLKFLHPQNPLWNSPREVWIRMELKFRLRPRKANGNQMQTRSSPHPFAEFLF